ncbi:LAMI_0D00254g1_1 [Lachancea mirantina]|uniref:LAMI_0D00254g1_1 n=1 Tax=Lachancea mirantina TaxID=1230905 RepID=A0A1G4J7Z5_9SACH|nr:LAMI_0D00254g1_1 [Lachancea mirantina]
MENHSEIDKGAFKVSVRDDQDISATELEQGTVEDYFIDVQEENALLRKLDRRLLPMLAFMYFLSSLDRSNIGNAYTSGMKEDLSLTPRQYSNAVSVFYSTYLAAELPAVWLLKIAKPRYYMSCLVLCWSLITLFTGFVQSYKSLLAVRVLLGTFEGGFFPAMTLLITMTYKPQEQAKRIAFFFGSSALSGAFGGLIATGLASVKNAGGLEGWRWLYIIEGLISVGAAFWLFFGLPDNIENMSFLNDREQALMRTRSKQRIQYMGENSKFSWKEVSLAFKDLKTYFAFVIQFCQDTILYGFSTFLTAILKLGLGYNSRQAQYMSVPVYILAAIVFLISAYMSDRFKIRGPVFFAYNLLGAVGYIILLTVKKDAVKYFACYLITFSLYTGTGLNITWLTNNVAPHYKRATALGLNQTLGNLSGAIVGQVYTKSPYVLGNSFSLGCIILSNILAALQIIWLMKLNKDKAAISAGLKKDSKKERIGDEALNFKYCL